MAVLNAVPLIQTVPGDPRANLYLHGPLIAVELSLPVPPRPPGVPMPAPPPLGMESGLALIDTGASNTVIDDAAANRLALISTGSAPACGISGPYMAQQYAVGWRLAGNPTFDTIPVTAAPLFANQKLLMIIGRDILGGCVLVYNGVNGTFTLAW